ncbi:unnamed protein product [Soboliphyme baturini]|uniref:Uncharacterized protein n=1 Tax=Soboliphyme baturini TaxID=241478 RepID=A0A183IQB2_9BILA|nr:unnamed protein product [Soboliphyme baturini]
MEQTSNMRLGKSLPLAKESRSDSIAAVAVAAAVAAAAAAAVDETEAPTWLLIWLGEANRSIAPLMLPCEARAFLLPPSECRCFSPRSLRVCGNGDGSGGDGGAMATGTYFRRVVMGVERFVCHWNSPDGANTLFGNDRCITLIKTWPLTEGQQPPSPPPTPLPRETSTFALRWWTCDLRPDGRPRLDVCWATNQRRCMRP